MPAETASKPSQQLARRLRARSAMLRCTLAALAAWIITLMPLATSGRSSALGRTLAVLSLGPGIAGAQLIARNHRMARHVGVTAFLAVSVAAWAWASKDGVLATLDIFRSMLGALAWIVFAVAWSHPWSVGDEDLARAPEGETSGLKPRRRPPAYAVGVAVLGAAAALSCLAAPWFVTEPSRGVLAHAVATGCAVALITSAATVAVTAGRERKEEGKPRLPIDRRVVNTMLFMLLVGAMILAVFFTSR
ncbi:MAG TPA: hypothetical protein VFB62_19045 [Polyangiaceae bacterium]|nr:hypothetical protein [Polyangiaceae bacterium]